MVISEHCLFYNVFDVITHRTFFLCVSGYNNVTFLFQCF